MDHNQLGKEFTVCFLMLVNSNIVCNATTKLRTDFSVALVVVMGGQIQITI